MRTVKQVSEMTGISVRALHYYDQIGLLRPTVCNEAGYRFYDDKALEILRQILFFREFDMPLKEIKAILDSPDYDREQVLRSQKRLLELKMKRLERLISNMNDILKGEDKMDFDVFSKAEIEELYKHMTDKMNESQRQAVREKFGSMEAFKAHYIENASSENVQENFKKVVEWYGDKQAALDASKILPVLRSCRHTRTGLMISAADWQQKERCRRILLRSNPLSASMNLFQNSFTRYPTQRK